MPTRTFYETSFHANRHAYYDVQPRHVKWLEQMLASQSALSTGSYWRGKTKQRCKVAQYKGHVARLCIPQDLNPKVGELCIVGEERQ
jgi:hypothetical protein